MDQHSQILLTQEPIGIHMNVNATFEFLEQFIINIHLLLGIFSKKVFITLG